MHLELKRNASRFTAVGAAVASLVLVTATGALLDLNEQQNGGKVTGTFGTANNRTTWNITIEDTASDGDCVYAEVQVDRTGTTDPEFPGPKACGKGTRASYSGERTYSDAAGSRVKICNTEGVPDHCVTVDTNADD